MTDPNYTNYGPKPKRKVVTIGLETFQLVNWFDYRGWEVRQFREFVPDLAVAPVTLGWVSEWERSGGNVWSALRLGAMQASAPTFPTREKAVLALSDLLDPDDEDALPVEDDASQDCDECSGTHYPDEQHEEHCSFA